jgi:hypothetical protein
VAKRVADQPAGKVNELILAVEAVLKEAREKKNGNLVLRATAELRELYLAKVQILMGVDAERALRLIDDAALIEEIKRRGLSLDQKVTWTVIHDASPELAPENVNPPELPESPAEISRPESPGESNEQQ